MWRGLPCAPARARGAALVGCSAGHADQLSRCVRARANCDVGLALRVSLLQATAVAREGLVSGVGGIVEFKNSKIFMFSPTF